MAPGSGAQSACGVAGEGESCSDQAAGPDQGPELDSIMVEMCLVNVRHWV